MANEPSKAARERAHALIKGLQGPQCRISHTMFCDAIAAALEEYAAERTAQVERERDKWMRAAAASPEGAPEGSGDVRVLLREAGWSVAVHNDYRLNGVPMTFWLFTHPDGRYIKGEGLTDEEALRAAYRASLASPPPTKGEG